MPWYRCEAVGASSSGGDSFAVTRFVEADEAGIAALKVAKCVGRELVRQGADPLAAERCVNIETVVRIDEDEVPGIAPDIVWRRNAA
ncbi:MAG: hypothetical protein WCH83_02840 [Alphaproteobacteria bacterium]|jgi:hypothetical protein